MYVDVRFYDVSYPLFQDKPTGMMTREIGTAMKAGIVTVGNDGTAVQTAIVTADGAKEPEVKSMPGMDMMVGPGGSAERPVVLESEMNEDQGIVSLFFFPHNKIID